jgi:hypothetical protein
MIRCYSDTVNLTSDWYVLGYYANWHGVAPLLDFFILLEPIFNVSVFLIISFIFLSFRSYIYLCLLILLLYPLLFRLALTYLLTVVLQYTIKPNIISSVWLPQSAATMGHEQSLLIMLRNNPSYAAGVPNNIENFTSMPPLKWRQPWSYINQIALNYLV